ncbi:MAG: hypothetical protein EOM19_07615 [Candidatus Moranbacteria bacterium]|nr:hypothetical protein [Candidatus Moranbacteria bacterium]
MNKLVAIGILVLLGFFAYGIGIMLSKNREVSNFSSEMKVNEGNDSEIIEFAEGDPDVRGRIISISEKYLILSQSTLENALTEEDRLARQKSMQSMSEADREALRLERTVNREVNTEQVRIGFAENVRFLKDTGIEGESPTDITWEDIQKDANVSIWTQQNTTDMATLVLVRQRLAN